MQVVIAHIWLFLGCYVISTWIYGVLTVLWDSRSKEWEELKEKAVEEDAALNAFGQVPKPLEIIAFVIVAFLMPILLPMTLFKKIFKNETDSSSSDDS